MSSGGATTSSTAGVSTTDTPVQAEVEKQPDVVFKSGKEKDRDSGLSAKEIRNMRRNGTPSKRKSEEESVSVSESVSASFSTSSVSSSSSGGKRGRDNSGISSTGGRNAIVSKSVGGSGSAGGSGSVSSSSSSSSVSEKKRKQPGTSDTGMFYNDVSSATSITDIDKRMGTKTTAGVSSKKQRR